MAADAPDNYSTPFILVAGVGVLAIGALLVAYTGHEETSDELADRLVRESLVRGDAVPVRGDLRQGHWSPTR